MQLHGCFNLLVLNQVQQYRSQTSSSSELIKLTRRIYSFLLCRITGSAARKDTKKHLTHLGDVLTVSLPWQIFDEASQKASVNGAPPPPQAILSIASLSLLLGGFS